MPRNKLKIVTDSCCKIASAHLPGRSSKGYAACGVLFLDEENQVISEHSQYLGEMTVPQAEYRGLIFALDKASGVCRGELEVWMDSEFVVRQLNGDYGIKSDNMKPLFHEVKALEHRFSKGVRYFHHPREAELAVRADQLANKELKKYRP